MRLRSRWTQKDQVRTMADLGGVAAVNAWRVACNGVLNLENEGFETRTQAQRLDIIEEFAALLVLLADRFVYLNLEPEQRSEFVTAMALRLADLVDENRQDSQGPGDHRSRFIDQLNERTALYSSCPFGDDDGPGFGMLCALGDHITEVIGPKQRRWVQDQVVAIEGPDAARAFRDSLAPLFNPDLPRPRRRRGA
jgi:hypothetical protein